MKNKKKVWLLVGIIMAMAVLVCAGIGLVASNRDKKVEKQLELGEKYLDDLKYEKAVAAFLKAYDIEPNKSKIQKELANAYILWCEELAEEGEYEEAIEHLEEAKEILEDNEDLVEKLEECEVECYLAWADSYLAKGDYEKALDILEKGYKKLKDSRLSEQKDMVEQLLEGSGLTIEMVEELQEQADTMTDVTKVIQEAADKVDYDTIFQEMGSTEFRDVLDKLNGIGLEEPYIVDLGNNKKVGFYPVKTTCYGDVMVYYGDYVGNERHGQGLWLGYKEEEYYYAQGRWVEDKPNGEQYVREWNTNLDSSVITRVLEGNVEEGLWDGQISWGFETQDGFEAWYVGFDQGLWVILEANEYDEYFVVSRAPYTTTGNSHGGTLSTDEPLVKEGIEGFLQ